MGHLIFKFQLKRLGVMCRIYDFKFKIFVLTRIKTIFWVQKKSIF